MEWVELPAQRLLCVSATDVTEHFDVRGEPGERLYVRRRDERVFRRAGLQPLDGSMNAMLYLQDV